jgi:DNA-binding NtrC family response regulator
MIAQAAGGTLLLDEIEDAPAAVQGILMRLFEARTYQVAGSTIDRPVRARLIATSAGGLADAVDRGDFRAALFHRVAAHEIAVPPLRERRDDIARLAVHVAAEQLAAIDRRHLLEVGGARPWFPLEVIEWLITSAWPGNVRELANTVRQLALRGADQPVMSMPVAPRAVPEPAAPSIRAPAASAPGDVAGLLAALRANDWALGPTAIALGVPRSTLYDRMSRAGIRAARDISDDELAAVFEQRGRDVIAVSEALRVSRRAVVLRLRAMGLLSTPR